MALSPNEGAASKKYNLNSIYKRLKKFYKDKLNIAAEENFLNFDSKKAVEQSSPEEYQKLIELLCGISAQCEKREFYLNIMQSMAEDHSSILFHILTERITDFIEEDQETNLHNYSHVVNSENEDAEENVRLTLKIEELEIEKKFMNEKAVKLAEYNKNLIIEKDNCEKKYRDLEERYKLLIDGMEYEKNKKSSSENQGDTIEDALSLTIKLSELKGILEGTDKNFTRYKEEKEVVIEKLHSENQFLLNKIEILNEFKIKIEILDKENHLLRNKLMNLNSYNTTNNPNVTNNSQLLGLEANVEALSDENIILKKEKKELEELVEKLNEDINKLQKETEKNKQRLEKYNIIKEENKSYQYKTSELLESNLKLREEINSIKIQENRAKQDLENKLNVILYFVYSNIRILILFMLSPF